MAHPPSSGTPLDPQGAGTSHAPAGAPRTSPAAATAPPTAEGPGTGSSYAPLSGTSLRWAMGLFCGFVGAFMLVAPHQFAAPVYERLRPFATAWAAAALAAGVGLLAAAATRTRRAMRRAAHGLASLVLLALAFGFAGAGTWAGTFTYGVLAGGLLLPAGLRGRPPRGPAGDLLSLLMGVIGTLTGAWMAFFPEHLAHNSWVAAGHPSYARALGLALLATGPPLAWAQLRLPPLRRLWAVHLAAGASLLPMGAMAAVPPPAWTGIALFWGVGSAVALLPGLRQWSADLDPSALRTRLALALATAASLALVLAAAVSTSEEERLATLHATETLGVEARSVAQNVRDYVELNGARAATLAALCGQLPLAGGPQRQLFEASRPRYRDASGLLLLGLDGRLLAADGGVALDQATREDLAGATAARSEAPVELASDRASGRRLLLVAAPVFGRDGRPAAEVVMAFDSRSLERRIGREDTIVSLGDGRGTLIARHSGIAGGVSKLPAGWDRRAASGSPLHVPGRLAASAVVPDFHWTVAIERPRESALAGVNRGRELAFAMLLLVLPLAIAGGIQVARRITRPLGALADAVDELTAGNPWAPLESSRISEVERLSAAFREMRDRLARRTAESERLAAELRARAEALTESDRRKDEFLAMLAHELRNPLGAVSTAAYILGQARAVEPPVARSISVIQRQSQHLARLVDDLLDVSRITRGKVELHRVPLDLAEVVKQAVETTRPLAEARHHRLEVSLPAEPLPLLADPTRIEQVLANLIRNAVKFTEPGGRVEIAAAAEGGEAMVSVRDTGAGISGELLPRVFDLFVQGQQGLDRSAGGLGIGLTLVRRLVEMHGGRVAASSDGPGRGSEFTIWLPLASAPAAAAQLAAAGASGRAQRGSAASAEPPPPSRR
jgi:signal transduction histidine kinase